MNSGTTDSAANRLLVSLPTREYQRLLRLLEIIPLKAEEILYEPGQLIEYVYFPCRGCLASLILGMGDDRKFDAGVVGYEGVIGVEVFLGGTVAHYQTTVLAAGTALRMKARAFGKELRKGGALDAQVRRYVQFLLATFAQVAGCNRFHSLEGHFCSFLLRLQDHSGGDTLELTHEQFAQMLGMRRVGVTQVARKLRAAGLIRYRWGNVVILDRQGLESSACVCHRQIVQAGQELIGFPSSHS